MDPTGERRFECKGICAVVAKGRRANIAKRRAAAKKRTALKNRTTKKASTSSTVAGAVSGAQTAKEKAAIATKTAKPSQVKPLKVSGGVFTVASGVAKSAELKQEGRSTQAAVAGGTTTAATGAGITAGSAMAGGAIGGPVGAVVGAVVGTVVDMATGASDKAGNAVANAVDNPGQRATSEGCTVRTSAGGCD